MNLKRTKILGLLVGWLALAASSGSAEPASGAYMILSPPALKIWDVSGLYSASENGASLEFRLSVNSSGKISGTGSGTLHDGTNRLEASVTCFGIQHTTAGRPRVSMFSKISGGGEVDGLPVFFAFKARRFWEIDLLSRTLIGRATAKLNTSITGISRRAEVVSRTNEVLALPETMTGDWTIHMNIEPVSLRYTGSSELILANGRAFPLTLSGRYAPETGRSRFVLRGGTNAPGVMLVLNGVVTNSVLTLQSLNGKALGQKLIFPPRP